MPPIDPERLLRTLSPLLDQQTGAIKSLHEVDKLYGLMAKFSKKLVSKVIYLNILKASQTDVLDLFMHRGGWDMVCNWATEGLNQKNWPFLKVIADLLILTPTTVARLKDNDLPKIIKSLAKECEDEGMRIAAYQVFQKWMSIAQPKVMQPARYVGADGQPIPVEGPASDYDLQQGSVPVSENQILLEPDPTSGAFDLTEYIVDSDLTNLATDFNPDDFNTTVDQHLMSSTELADCEMLPQDSLVQRVDGQEPQMTQLVSPMKLQATDADKAPVCVVFKDGKRFMLKLSGTEPSATSDAIPVPVLEKKPQSAGKPKMPPISSGKPKMPSGGKPPLKAYEAKAKKANTSDAKGVANFYGKDKSKDKDDKEKDQRQKDKARSKEKELERKKQQSVVSASRAAIEAKRRLEDEKAEKLRVKIMEQKRIRDQRKEDQAKKQKEIDDETMKALKLTAQPPTKIPKIPKKISSFADMIAIPGASNSKEAKKVTTTSSTSKASKEKEAAKPKEKDVKEETVSGRSSRPKVYVSGKSRSLGLLEEMEQAQVKGQKGKEKDAEQKDLENVLPSEKKGSKRPSSEKSESPSKKPKKEVKKVVAIQESSLFMDALNSATTTRQTRSSRRRSSESGLMTTPKEKEPGAVTTSPPLKSPAAEETKPVVFNFYRDTLGDNDDKKDDTEEDRRRASASTINSEDQDGDNNNEADAFVPAEGEGALKSNLVIHRQKNKPKKAVHWVEDEELKTFHYFEMDETERINVTKTPRNFTEMKLNERSEERKVLKRNLRKDSMEEKILWNDPKPFVFDTPPLETGAYSYEKQVQMEREGRTLGVVYFSAAQVPDSPVEPDEPQIKNQDDPATLKRIPFDDIPGVTQSQTHTFKPFEGRPYSGGAMETAQRPLVGMGLPNANYPPPVPPPLDPVAAQQAQHLQAQAQYMLSTLSQAGGMPGTDIWSQIAGLQQMAQGLAAIAPAIPNLPLNLPFGFSGVPPGNGPPPPASAYTMPNPQQLPPNQYIGPGNSRFGPAPSHDRGAGTRGPRENQRGGRPNRWDDRGNYDDRRRDERNRGNERDREKGRGGYSDSGRDREFPRSDRNRQGVPRTVLCKFYQQGCCKSGSECNYLHPGINGPARPARSGSRFSSPPPSSRNPARVDSPLSNTIDDDNWDVEPSNNESAKAENSFDHPPSSPTHDEEPMSEKPPRLIPVTESEPMDTN